MLRGRPLDVDALGVRMRLYPTRNTSEKNLLFTPHLFDPEERSVIDRFVTNGFVFIDIGANVGGYALSVAAQAGPTARIIAIEPHPELFERLAFNMRQNPFGTVKALECAVTDRDGTAILFIDPHNNGQSSVRVIQASVEHIAVKVTARSLKAIVDEERLQRIDAIKIDVEGAEDLILESFFRDVDEALWPRLLIVDDPRGHMPDVVPVLGDSGVYRLIGRTRSNSLYERRESLSNAEEA